MYYEYTNDTVGNMTLRSEISSTITYTCNDSNHVHAVANLTGGSSFANYANGNMTCRSLDGANNTRKFDVENSLVAITDSVTISVTQFVYPAKASGLRDGAGNRVKTIYPDSSWTAYPANASGLHIGDHYEVESDNTTRSYYFLGSQRIAMRIDNGQTDPVYFFHTDHPSAALCEASLWDRAGLGSTSLLSDEIAVFKSCIKQI